MKKILVLLLLLVIAGVYSFNFKVKKENMKQQEIVKNNTIVPIFVASDNNYAKYVATTLASILMHTEAQIDYYILDDSISPENKKKIINTTKYFKNKKVNIKFIKIDAKKEFADFRTFAHFTLATYSRYLIPILPESQNLKKVIYMDVDMIVQKDIQELYNEDLEDNIIGVVSDSSYTLFPNHNTEKLKKMFNIKGNMDYFNSGLMLIDCEKWRQQNMTSKLIEITKHHSQNKNETFLLDQDMLNGVFVKHKALDSKYNAVLLAAYIFDELNDELKKYYQESTIIHYNAAIKPWKIKTSFMAQKFWDVVDYTDFKDDINNDYNKQFENTNITDEQMRDEKIKLMKKIVKGVI